MKRHILLCLILIAALSYLPAYYFGQNKVNTRPVTWSMIETLHFDVHFPSGNDEFGRLVALMAEETYYYLKDSFQFPILSRIPIIVYGSKTEFQTSNIIYPLLSEGVGGFTESLKNRVVVPFDGSYKKLEDALTHELTHAYINAMDKGMGGSFISLRSSYFPFWFAEGLPELLSVGGESVYNNMFVLDMVVNDNIRPLEFLEGYLAYRLGESFLAYLDEIYGREKVMDYFYALRVISNLDDATRKVFGMKFRELESRWRFHLKRQFFPWIGTHTVPKEQFERRTNHQEDGSSLNYAPRFSRDGQRFVYFSNRGGRFSIWLSSAYGLTPPTRVLLGEASSKYEEFYYFRSTLSWFPDNRRITFVSKTSVGDRINIFDVDNGRLKESIGFDHLDGIYEIDVSPCGRYIAMSAQRSMQSDIYLLDLVTRELTQLTNDAFHDYQPRFSPDGLSIAFTSERSRRDADFRKGFFSAYVSNLHLYRIDDASLVQITFEDYNCTTPEWTSSGEQILFISERYGTANFDLLDLALNQRASVSQTLSGVFSGDLSPDDKNLVFSGYFQGGWNIYFASNPLDSLHLEDYPEPVPLELKEDLLDHVNLDQLNYFGRVPRPKPTRHHPARLRDPESPFFQSFDFTSEDSLRVTRNYSWDERPDSITVIPAIRSYRTRFSLDRLWGGVAYSPSVGTYGHLELGMSDLMGNHAIGMDLGISGKIKDSNILITYLNLKHRIDYAFGVYNIFNQSIYRNYSPAPEDDYFRVRERETGVYVLTRYPFSRFFRVDLDHRLYDWKYYLDDWRWNRDYTNGYWDEDIEELDDFVYAPGLSFVYDNALYGPTGPLLGWRGIYTIRKSFATQKMDYLTNYTDFRTYTLFSRRYAFATRTIAGISTGNRPQMFNLGGYYGVRAYSGDLSGRKKIMTSIELRYPMLDYLSMVFPLPITLTSVRGSLFADLGTVWNKNVHFRGVRDGKLEDLYLGYGFGPRINLGYVILKLDVAWLSDLSRISKPTFYLSLTEDF